MTATVARERVRVNEMHLLVGSPGVGKSTRMLELGRAWLRQGRWLFVHDTAGDFDKLCSMYRSVDEWRARMRTCEAKDLKMRHGAAFTMMDPTPMTRLARELGQRHNSQHHAAMPIMIAYDESALLDGTSASHADKVDVETLVLRRHLGLAPVYNLQDTTLLPARFFKLATDVYCYSVADAADLVMLARRTGAPPGAFDSMLNAEPHRYLHWERNKGRPARFI